jgi:membrane protease YdiL (CAAX protease family)
MNPEPNSPASIGSSVPTPAPPGTGSFPVWNGWDILFLFFFTSFTTMLFSTMGQAINHLLQVKIPIWAQWLKNPASEGVSILLLQVLLDGVILTYIFLTIVLKYNAPFFPSIGWTWKKTATWSSYLLLGFFLALLVLTISNLFPPKEPPPIERLLKHPLTSVLYASLGILVAPFTEEILFRGFIYPVLERRLNLWWSSPKPVGAEESISPKIRIGQLGAIVITGVLFALLHASQLWGSWVGTALILGVGLTLSTIRSLTGSVVPGFLLHLAYNSTICLLFFVGVLVKGFPN